MVFTIRDTEHTNCIGIATNLEGISKILVDYITDTILETEADYGGDYSDVVNDISFTVNKSLEGFNPDNKYTPLYIKFYPENKELFNFIFDIEIIKYQLNVYS